MACILILARFIFLGDTPFINDQPILQLLLDTHEEWGTRPVHGLYGSHLIPYGPTALWLYDAIRLFSLDHYFILIVFITLQCLGLVLFYLALCNLFSKSNAVWPFLLATSSPYLYFYSRLMWDNNFLVPISGGIFWLLSKWWRDYENGAWQVRFSEWALFGILSGLAFNTHLMSIFLLIVSNWNFYRGISRR